MTGPTMLKLLIVEDNLDFFYLLKAWLDKEELSKFDIKHETCLAKAVSLLDEMSFDVILLDLGLSDSQGIETFLKVRQAAPKSAIVILSGLDHESVAMDAVRSGAQDYVVKGAVDLKFIPRVIQYAVQRQQNSLGLQDLSLKDSVTGLYNRRGFLMFGLEFLKLAQRHGRSLSLLMIDLDGLKEINDRWGHMRGDLAITKTAEILKSTFRDSDVIARLGGDEFAVMAPDTPYDSGDAIRRRLKESFAEYNRSTQSPFVLSASVGIAGFDPKKIFCIEQLMVAADKDLYGQKRMKQT